MIELVAVAALSLAVGVTAGYHVGWKNGFDKCHRIRFRL